MVSGAVTLVLLFVEALIVILCIHTVFGKKIELDWMTIEGVVLYVLWLGLINQGYIPQAGIVIVALIFWIYCLFKFRFSIIKTTIFYIIGLALASALEAIIQYAIYKLHIINNANCSYLVSISGAFISAFFIYKGFYKRTKLTRIRKSFMCTMIIYGLIFSMLMIDYHYCNTSQIDLYCVIVFIFLLLGYVYLYRLERAHDIIEKKTLENKLQDVYGQAYEELLNEVRRKQHDFKNQLGAILSMHLMAESKEELVDMQNNYSKKLIQNDKFDSILLCCNNRILAGYIYSKLSTCEEKEIEVTYEINVNQVTCEWGLHELIEVLGILIDNACEYVLQDEIAERKIDFTFLECENQIEFSVSNPALKLSSKEIERLFTKGYSTKGKDRGIGLSRVSELIDKRNSQIEVKNILIKESNWIEFRIIIEK